MNRDTVFALATAPGRAGVAIVRVSGPEADAACLHLAGRLPRQRMASLCRLRDEGGDTLDEALVLRFPPGGSFTGERVVEFQCHGSRAVVSAVMLALGRLDGLRPAEAGEFTRRALENDRLDLAQVEGLADLIDAESEAQRRQAMRALSGSMAERVESWRARLLRAAALVEATIDFADEEVPEDVWPEVEDLVASLIVDIRGELEGVTAAQRVREGFEVAIVGPPNAGKSTLLNRLAGRDAAITSETAGTTRDIVEVRMEVLGQVVTFIDTAGLREAEDPLEAEGIRRARERAQGADLRLIMGDVAEIRQEGDILLRPKADLSGEGDGLGVSGVTGEGVDALLAMVGERVVEGATGVGVAVRERHAVALTCAVEELRAASEDMGAGEAEVIAPQRKVVLPDHHIPELLVQRHQQFDRLLRACDDV